MATNLSQFLVFAASVGDAHPRSPDDFRNDGTLNEYIWPRFLYGMEAKRWIVNGGLGLTHRIAFDHNKSARSVGFDQDRTWDSQPKLASPRAFMRVTESFWSITNGEFSKAMAEAGGDTDFDKFVNIIDVLQEQADTSHKELLEKQLWAVPERLKMEGDAEGTLEPFSLWSLVNDRTNGLFTLAPGGTWTTKAGLNPADASVTNGRWDNQRTTYTNTTPGTTHPIGVSSTILDAMDRIEFSSKFAGAKNPEEAELAEQRRRVYITSHQGVNHIRAMQRATGTQMFSKLNDRGLPMPVHNGIDILKSNEMRLAAVYDNGAGALATEATDNQTGPRVMAIDGNALHPVVHGDYFWVQDPPMNDLSNPDKWVIRRQMWWNLYPHSLRVQGFISPAASITDPGIVY